MPKSRRPTARRLTILEFSGAPLLARPLQRGVRRRTEHLLNLDRQTLAECLVNVPEGSVGDVADYAGALIDLKGTIDGHDVPALGTTVLVCQAGLCTDEKDLDGQPLELSGVRKRNNNRHRADPI